MEQYLQILFSAALFVPLIVFVLSIALRSESANTIVHTLFIMSGIAGLSGVGFALSTGLPIEIAPFLHIGLVAEGTRLFFLALIFGGMVLTSMFALDYVRRYADVYRPHWLNAATALFIFGMQATVLSMSVIGFLLAWEIMSLAAYFLVIADRKDESLRAGFLYLLMTHIGFVALSAGFLILSSGDPWATWSDLATSAMEVSPLMLATSFFLLFIGFGSKAGLVPLHQWLPYAHPQAPSHSSALLSGVMLKVALFGFLQSLALFPMIPAWWGLVVIIVGITSALFGVISAAVESDMKRLLAWSSIENMGLIFSAVGGILVLAALPPNPASMVLIAALTLFVSLHALNHMLFKTGLFMSAGAIAALAHTRDLDNLGGLAQKWPLFSGAVLALVLGAAALPPFGTFFGEWLYVQSLATAIGNIPFVYSAGAVIVLAFVGLVAGLAIFTFVNFFSTAFLGRARTKHAEEVGAMPRTLILPPFISGLLLLMVGPFAIPLLRGVPVSAPLAIAPTAAINPLFIVFLFVLIGILVWSVYELSKTKVRTTETWDCGQPLTPRMQYTSTGFTAPIRFFFRSVVLAKKRMIVTPIAAGNPWIAKRKLEWSVASFWEAWLYRPFGTMIVRAATLAQRLQGGVVQVYLLLLVIALVAVFIFAL